MVLSFPGRTASWSDTGTPADLLRVARTADRLGYAYLTVSDHVAVPAHAVERMGGTWYAPIPTLAFIAAATERIGLCTHVLVMPYRHPLMMARELGTLDHLSGGRVILGAGTGYLRSEFRALGVDHTRRGAITDAALETLIRQWNGGSELVIKPSPVQAPRPRIWIGGNGIHALTRALRVADGWTPWQIGLDEVRALLATHGHPGEVVLGASFDPVGAAGAAEPVDAMLGRLQSCRAAGVTAVTAGFPSRSLDEYIEQVEAFAATVLPQCELVS